MPRTGHGNDKRTRPASGPETGKLLMCEGEEAPDQVTERLSTHLVA
jgi:hypothetical protein